MSKIMLMKPELAYLIAAGEVIERPSSVIKELVENSIDAGARNIYIGVSHGGKGSIIVKDDGSGMDREDAKNCFLRHASSKVKSEYDLTRIRTLGFRGEALPSIAACRACYRNRRRRSRNESEKRTERSFDHRRCPLEKRNHL